MFVWQVFDDDGRWGTIAAIAPGGTVMPLVHRDRKTAEWMRPLAINGSRSHPVRLARYDIADVLEQHEPNATG